MVFSADVNAKRELAEDLFSIIKVFLITLFAKLLWSLFTSNFSQKKVKEKKQVATFQLRKQNISSHLFDI